MLYYLYLFLLLYCYFLSHLHIFMSKIVWNIITSVNTNVLKYLFTIKNLFVRSQYKEYVWFNDIFKCNYVRYIFILLLQQIKVLVRKLLQRVLQVEVYLEAHLPSDRSRAPQPVLDYLGKHQHPEACLGQKLLVPVARACLVLDLVVSNNFK